MKTLKWIIIILNLILISEPMQGQDWPNLSKFKEQNKILMEGPVNPNRIVFIGNSITEGWLNSPSGFFKNRDFINRGIGGQTTPQMLLRFRQDVINLKPKAVAILAGINDIAHNTGPMTTGMTIDNFKSMIELALVNDIKVIMCSILPANRFAWRPEIEPATKVKEINSTLKKLSNNKNIFYVDFYSKMVDDKMGLRVEFGEDGVHPNANGYAVMESIILDFLHKNL